jgi:hypothetical protein
VSDFGCTKRAEVDSYLTDDEIMACQFSVFLGKIITLEQAHSIYANSSTSLRWFRTSLEEGRAIANLAVEKVRKGREGLG